MTSSILSRSKGWRLCAVLFVLWGVAPLPAVGAEISAEAKAQARVKFDEGNAAYARGEFRQALEAFDAAYQLAPLPGFLFNVAQCHRQLGNFERAAFFYRRYLALSEKEPANAELVKGLIAEMDAQAQREPASRAGREGPAAQAKAVEKERPAAVPVKGPEASGAPRRVKEAEQRALDLRKRRSLSTAPKGLPPAAVPAAPGPGKKESLTRKWWVWAGAGVAAALVTGGIIYATTASEPRPTTLGTIPVR
ncbi:MAG: tetratricopeptide repeat protein [Myxococcaceae bacterium]|nr:tetratricopeptide repeat protein [Myxococcaceae bacterium]